jgi:hypothetical protein
MLAITPQNRNDGNDHQQLINVKARRRFGRKFPVVRLRRRIAIILLADLLWHWCESDSNLSHDSATVHSPFELVSVVEQAYAANLLPVKTSCSRHSTRHSTTSTLGTHRLLAVGCWITRSRFIGVGC